MNGFPDSFFTYISSALIDFFSTASPQIEAAGARIFHWIVVIVVGLFFAEMLFVGFDARHAVKLVFAILVCSLIIHYYSAPIPFAGQSFHGVITDTAKYWSDKLESGQDQALQDRLNYVYVNMEAPTLTRWSAAFYYWIVVALIAVMRFALIFIVGIGFLAMGICTILGPLFIPFMIFPGLEFLFWSWFKSFLAYAMYQVVAAAMVNIMANFLLRFFDAVAAQPLTLANLEVMFIELTVALLVGIFGLFKVPSIASSLMSGRAGEGLWRV